MALSLVPLVSAAARYDLEKPLRQAVWAGRFLEGIRQYDGLVAKGIEPSGQASYLAGWAYWRLRRPEDAKPLLEKAVQSGFRAGGGRPQPGEVLDKVGRYLASKPPSIEVSGLDRSLLDPYLDSKTALTQPILDALPRFVEIGRSIFGQPPPVRYFIFAKKPAFGRFFDALAERERPDPHSTGMVSMVIYCEEKAHRATAAETIGNALHELTHAWIETYLRLRYDRRIVVPPYVHEGLAVYVSTLWSDDLRLLMLQRLSRWRQKPGVTAPEFHELIAFDSFHDSPNVNLNYLLSYRLMERLLGPASEGSKKIPSFLDALARTDDHEAAWREATGKDVREEYKALVAELWR